MNKKCFHKWQISAILSVRGPYYAFFYCLKCATAIQVKCEEVKNE